MMCCPCLWLILHLRMSFRRDSLQFLMPIMDIAKFLWIRILEFSVSLLKMECKVFCKGSVIDFTLQIVFCKVRVHSKSSSAGDVWWSVSLSTKHDTCILRFATWSCTDLNSWHSDIYKNSHLGKQSYLLWA